MRQIVCDPPEPSLSFSLFAPTWSSRRGVPPLIGHSTDANPCSHLKHCLGTPLDECVSKHHALQRGAQSARVEAPAALLLKGEERCLLGCLSVLFARAAAAGCCCCCCSG